MIVGTTYGFDVKAENDRVSRPDLRAVLTWKITFFQYIIDAEKIMEIVGPMLFPGHPVDLLPICL